MDIKRLEAGCKCSISLIEVVELAYDLGNEVLEDCFPTREEKSLHRHLAKILVIALSCQFKDQEQVVAVPAPNIIIILSFRAKSILYWVRYNVPRQKDLWS